MARGLRQFEGGMTLVVAVEEFPDWVDLIALGALVVQAAFWAGRRRFR
jgi:hypothetical protein